MVNNIRYHEIYMQRIQLPDATLQDAKSTFFQLKIRNITSLIRSQQKHCNQMYQDAIEANFSHEQMNPLNTILNNSKLVINLLKQLTFDNPNAVKKQADILELTKQVT